jgi:hypothetical protein
VYPNVRKSESGYAGLTHTVRQFDYRFYGVNLSTSRASIHNFNYHLHPQEWEARLPHSKGREAQVKASFKSGKSAI